MIALARPMILVLALASILGSPAVAGSITNFSSRSAFQTAVGGPVTVETFTSSFHYPISTGVLNSATNLVVGSGTPILPGDIQPGVTYSTAIGSGNFFNIDLGGSGSLPGGFLDGFDRVGSPVLTTTFAGPVSGFGFDTNSFMGTLVSIDIKFASGPDFTGVFSVAQSQNIQFFGFLSDSKDITSAQILGIGPFFAFALDNFTFSSTDPVNPVPEPATVGMAGTAAVVGLVVWFRKRRRLNSKGSGLF